MGSHSHWSSPCSALCVLQTCVCRKQQPREARRGKRPTKQALGKAALSPWVRIPGGPKEDCLFQVGHGEAAEPASCFLAESPQGRQTQRSHIS